MMGMVIRKPGVGQPFGPNKNPSTKTNKDDREPSWLLTLRNINNTVTSNIIAMKTTPTIHSKKISQIYTVARLKESTDPYIPSQYLFHNQSRFMDGEKTYL
jgi:hypothetical protein